MKNKIKTRLWGLGIAVVIIGTVTFFSCKGHKPGISFETAMVTRGSVSNTVTATGTLQATKTVEVGTQVSGVIKKLYVDYNSVVKKGQLLAEIDKVPLLASVDDANASLSDAQAEVSYNTANYNRIKALYDKQLVSQSDFDQATYSYNKALAALKSAKVKYDKAEINLQYANIFSPIDGVILNRAVDEGQTVAASFNTPTLFTIANDLTRMEVAANVDEADIGQLKVGQKVEFTVDAFPDLKFNGEVTEIRLQPVTTSNVVTYTVIVKAPNPDLKLMPGMTANITVIINRSDDILIVPGKALRFKPDKQMLTEYFNSLSEKEKSKMKPQESMLTPMTGEMKSDNKRKVSMPSEESTGSTDKSTVWVKEGDLIKPVPVKTGINDGINYEVLSGLSEGQQVVVSMTSEMKTVKKAASSPFMPKRPGGPAKK